MVVHEIWKNQLYELKCITYHAIECANVGVWVHMLQVQQSQHMLLQV